MCVEADLKLYLDGMKKAGIDYIQLPGTNLTVKVYCDGAVPPFSCTTDSDCDAE